jgi:hypothetical protein
MRMRPRRRGAKATLKNYDVLALYQWLRHRNEDPYTRRPFSIAQLRRITAQYRAHPGGNSNARMLQLHQDNPMSIRDQRHAMGYTAQDALDEGYTIEELMRMGYTIDDLNPLRSSDGKQEERKSPSLNRPPPLQRRPPYRRYRRRNIQHEVDRNNMRVARNLRVLMNNA